MSGVLSSHVGKWKLEGIENGEEFMKALGMNPEMAAKVAESGVEIENTLNGEEMTQKITSKLLDGKTVTNTFRLGVEFTEELFGPVKQKVTYTEEGGQIIRSATGGKHDVRSSIEVVAGKIVETMVCQSSPPVTAVRTLVKL